MILLEGIGEQPPFSKSMSGVEEANWHVRDEVGTLPAAKGSRQFAWEPCG